MNRRILCIEDEADLRSDLASELRDAGFDVVEAANGTSGLAEARSSQFDLILCDVQLPGASGLHLLEQLRTFGPLPPCIMLTAYGDRVLHDQACALGAIGTIVKPVDYGELLDTIDRVLGAEA